MTTPYPLIMNYLPLRERNLLTDLLVEAGLEKPFLVDGPGALKRLQLLSHLDYPDTWEDDLHTKLQWNRGALKRSKLNVSSSLGALLRRFDAPQLSQDDVKRLTDEAVSAAIGVTYLLAENAYICTVIGKKYAEMKNGQEDATPQFELEVDSAMCLELQGILFELLAKKMPLEAPFLVDSPGTLRRFKLRGATLQELEGFLQAAKERRKQALHRMHLQLLRVYCRRYHLQRAQETGQEQPTSEDAEASSEGAEALTDARSVREAAEMLQLQQKLLKLPLGRCLRADCFDPDCRENQTLPIYEIEEIWSGVVNLEERSARDAEELLELEQKNRGLPPDEWLRCEGLTVAEIEEDQSGVINYDAQEGEVVESAVEFTAEGLHVRFIEGLIEEMKSGK